MKLTRSWIFIFGLFPLPATAQLSKGIVIKTEILSNAIIKFNPNLAVEKPFTDRLSAELQGIWMRVDRVNTGGEGSRKKFHDSKGGSLVLSTRYYFGRKATIPNSKYLSGFIRYNSTKINNVEKIDFRYGYQHTVNVSTKGPELGFLVGKQFFLFENLMSEINFGLSNYWQSYKETLISGPPSSVFVNGEYNTKFVFARPYANFTVGYLIGRSPG